MQIRPRVTHTLSVLGLLCAAAGTTYAGAPTSVDLTRQDQIRWSSGIIERLAPMSQSQIRSSLQTLSSREDASHVLVRFERPLSQAQRDDLAAKGLDLLSSLGSTTYFANLRDGADLGALGNAPIRMVTEIERHQKLHGDLLTGRLNDWMISLDEPTRQGKLRESFDRGMVSREEFEKAGADPLVAVVVMFHQDVDHKTESQRLSRQLHATVASQIRSINAAVLHMHLSQIDQLAMDDSIMWVEPPLPPMAELNAENRALTNVDLVNAAPYGLDGTGVNVLIYDGGKMANHNDFGSRLTIGMSDTANTSDHATHVGGTVGGDGTATYNNRGMAPGVNLISYGFEQPGGLMQGFLYTDPGDIEDDYTEAINVYGAHISNNSIGTNTAPNGYPCDWTGNYGATGALIDAIARGSLGNPFRIVWANGNERQTSRCLGDDNGNFGEYFSTAPPAGAKNHITVGSVDSDTDLTSSFSSWGPVDDGRIKPDISAPGCQVGGDGGVLSTSSLNPAGYSVKCGTSMASPTVCGISALILEQYRLSFPDRDDLRNSTLKAILANTAVDRGNTGPDYQYGYGSVRADAAVDAVIAENVVEAEVGQGDIYRFVVIIGENDSELKVTMAWDDAPGTPNVDPVLVNDLDIRVIDSSSNIHMPWTLDPSNPSAPAVRTTRDGINNIEQVVIDNAAPGAYTVEVSGFNVAVGATQGFGVVSNGFLVNCSSNGLISMSGSRVQCDGSLNVQVIDCDLNTSDEVVDTVDVMISSTTDAGFMLTLTETAAESAAFTGSFTFSSSGGADLGVNEGDTITATYIDADDGEGNFGVFNDSTATVDCTAPMVLSASATDIEPRAAVASVTLDEPSSITVRYGETIGSLTQSAGSNSLSTSHDVAMTGLQDEHDYVFVVDATDQAGNMSTDDNGGVGYAFTTPDVPDFFTEQFGSGIDLVGSRVEFRPVATVEGYEACIDPITPGVFPVSPAGGVSVSLSDDDSEQISLSGGHTVQLYGEVYDEFYIGSNGYVTFGSGRSTYSESYGEHFSAKQVSALFDDLNPSQGGNVSYLELGDRVVVTFDGVPEHNGNNSNSFQIELYYDGTIAMSWISLDSNDAVIGLSEGNGQDPDFIASDLSVYDSCGPRAPYAADVSVQTPINETIIVQLAGADDGLPERPGELTYSVVSLPSTGTIFDVGSGSQIVSVPHVLASQGDMVEFVPANNYQGVVSFTYIADDGGTAPDGGESNVGTVSVTVGGPQPVYSFLVDDTNPGWDTTGAWAFGQPAGSSGDPSSGATGDNVYGYNLNGDYPNNMPQQFLTSESLDFTGVTQVTLTFERWLGVERSQYDHAVIQVSVNGGSWETIWENDFSTSMSESSWTSVSYDISGMADDQSDVRVRWIMGTTDTSVVYHGWNIDDIVFEGITEISACRPDYTGDGELDFFDISAFLTLFSAEDPLADYNGDNEFDFFDISSFLMDLNAGCP